MSVWPSSSVRVVLRSVVPRISRTNLSVFIVLRSVMLRISSRTEVAVSTACFSSVAIFSNLSTSCSSSVSILSSIFTEALPSFWISLARFDTRLRPDTGVEVFPIGVVGDCSSLATREATDPIFTLSSEPDP